MDNLQTFIILMFAAVLLVGVAQKFRVPYPLALVLSGAAIGFIPGLNAVSFDPNLILVIVLPPILYYAAHIISFQKFRQNFREIFSLALGLVIATTLTVAFLFHWLFPDLPWPLAFAFGAIISPPDAVAATAILNRFSISSRLLTILEGESLINDASGLVLYRLAVAALISGTFSLTDASIEAVKIALGGILIGFVTGFLSNKLSSRFLDPVLAVVYSFTVPYVTYILADLMNFSGVLAVVVNGLISSRMLITHFSSLTRVVGWASWDIVIILLNCFVFILIGLHLGVITQRMSMDQIILYSAYGIIFTVTVILVRIAWVYLNEGIRYLRLRKDPKCIKHWPQVARDAAILSWSGMRGIVSLVAALALPFSLPNGMLLPGRDITIFLTFIVLLLTLMIPGLTLKSLIKYLKIYQEPDSQSTARIRNQLLKAAEQEIQRLHQSNFLSDDNSSFLLNYFNARHHVLEFSSCQEIHLHNMEVARRKILRAQRRYLLHLWEHYEIDDRLLSLLERELDMEEAHLARAELK